LRKILYPRNLASSPSAKNVATELSALLISSHGKFVKNLRRAGKAQFAPVAMSNKTLQRERSTAMIRGGFWLPRDFEI
jgi:hypothetical protein